MASSWVAIEHPNGYSFIITMLTYAVRFTTVYLVKSTYNVSIGVIVSCLVGNICHLSLYYMYTRKDKYINSKESAYL